MDKTLILASASPRRRDLLAMMGYDFLIMPSNDEEVLEGDSPSEIVENLARQKACNVASMTKEKNAVIIGADTIVVCDGKIMGKPADRQDAFHMLSTLQGRTHQVYTGVTILDKEAGNQKEITFSECTKVSVHKMEEKEINWYLSRGESMDKAGAYGIQGSYAVFVDKVEGEYNNVLGLPAAGLYQQLKKIEFTKKEGNEDA